MAVESIVLTGTLSQTIGGTTDLTSSGFGTPDAAIIYGSVTNTTNNPQVGLDHSLGFWDGTNQYAIGAFSQDGLSSSITSRKSTLTNGLYYGTESNALEYTITNITDGIRITHDSGTTGVDRYVTVVLIKGVTNAYVGSKGLGTTVGAIDITDPGFKPDLVFMGCVGSSSVTTNTGENLFNVGVAHNNSSDVVSQGLIAVSSRDAQTTTVTNSYTTDTAITGQYFNNALAWKASIGSFDTNGFTLTTTANPGSDFVFYLALELPNPDDAWVDFIPALQTTGNQATTGVGFTPDSLGFLSAGHEIATFGHQDHNFMFSMNDSDTSNVYTSRDRDAQSGTSDVDSARSGTNAIEMRTSAGAAEAAATLSSLDADGFTLNYSDGASAVRDILSWAIGDSSGGGGLTVTAVPDALVLTESTATVTITINTFVDALPDTLTLTEANATVNIGSSTAVTAIPAALVLTEQTSTVQIGTDVTAIPDTLSLTEATATVTLGFSTNVTAIPDTLVLTEQLADVSAVVNTIVTAIPDNLTLTESLSSVSVTTTVTLESLSQQIADLEVFVVEMWKLMGLDSSNPTTTTKTTVDVDDIHQDITGDGINTSTITRTP